MDRDVFHWKMSAVAHQSAINCLRDDMIGARKKQEPFPIALLFFLLPIKSPQANQAIARGSLTFNGDRFSNTGDDDLRIEFEDPVLKTFSATVPASWAGTLSVAESSLSIKFDPAIELEIPRLAELGVNRSMFQQFLGLDVSPDAAISYLREGSAEARDTWLEVQINPLVLFVPHADIKIRALTALFGSGNDCAPPPSVEKKEWNVYRKKGGLCAPILGTVAVGGLLEYSYKMGPATKAECEEYIVSNCPGDVCDK